MVQTNRVTHRTKQPMESDDKDNQDDGETPSAEWFARIGFPWVIARLDKLKELDARGEPLPTTASELTRQAPLEGFQTVRITQILRMWGVVDAATQRVDGELLRLLIRPETRSATLARLARRLYGSDLDLLVDPQATKQRMAKIMSERWHASPEMIRRGVRFMIDMAVAAGLPVAPALKVNHYERQSSRTIPHTRETLRETSSMRSDRAIEDSHSEDAQASPGDGPLPEALRVALANGGIRVVDARQSTAESMLDMPAARDGQTGADVVWPDVQNGNHSLQHREAHRVESNEGGDHIGSDASSYLLRDGAQLTPEAQTLTRRFMAIVGSFPADAWATPEARDLWLEQLQQLANVAGILLGSCQRAIR